MPQEEPHLVFFYQLLHLFFVLLQLQSKIRPLPPHLDHSVLQLSFGPKMILLADIEKYPKEDLPANILQLSLSLLQFQLAVLSGFESSSSGEF